MKTGRPPKLPADFEKNHNDIINLYVNEKRSIQFIHEFLRAKGIEVAFNHIRSVLKDVIRTPFEAMKTPISLIRNFMRSRR